MPVINNATVASGSGYSTAGNGGRKIGMLEDGTMFAAIKESSGYSIYNTNNNWNTSKIWQTISANTGDIALVTNGTNIYYIFTNGTYVHYSARKPDGSLLNSGIIDTFQTVLGNVSLAINEAKTELHAVWTSRNSTYQSSFNVRYAKGTINADGTVTWDAVEQVTTLNNPSLDNSNPSIVVVDDKPFIFVGATLNTNYGIFLLTNSFTTKDANYNNINPNWGSKAVYFLATYAQSSPSAIFVPQSINGLSNGRIWVAWNGVSAPNSINNIKMSYSDDNGVSWANVINVTTETITQGYPTISYNNRNEIFIVWNGLDSNVSSSYFNIRKIKYANGTLSAIEAITNNTSDSAIYANSLAGGLDFDSPLFIYTNNQTSSVNFYGSWTTETISPTIGERGQILNRQNLLTYNITSESTIGTVTEKINGVVVGTKTLTSGQNTTINITQSQWDSIPYGKYRNNSAGRNIIEIVTSNNTFIYTFEKWFDNTLDVISVTKAVKDSKDYYLPSAKKILSDAINSKGGSTTPTDSIESMATQIVSSGSRKYNQGTSTPTGIKNFNSYSGSALSSRYISLDISSIGFVPSKVIVNYVNKTTQSFTLWEKDDFYVSGSSYANCALTGTLMRAPISGDILDIPINGQDTVNWVAYE